MLLCWIATPLTLRANSLSSKRRLIVVLARSWRMAPNSWNLEMLPSLIWSLANPCVSRASLTILLSVRHLVKHLDFLYWGVACSAKMLLKGVTSIEALKWDQNLSSTGVLSRSFSLSQPPAVYCPGVCPLTPGCVLPLCGQCSGYIALDPSPKTCFCFQVVSLCVTWDRRLPLVSSRQLTRRLVELARSQSLPRRPRRLNENSVRQLPPQS